MNCTKKKKGILEVIYSFRSAWLATSVANKVENSFGGFGEVGVGAKLCVLLGFLYGPQ